MKRTPFYEILVRHGARMVDFAGYEMPVQFSKGIIAEHKAVRERVGLFDVSHMGELFLKGETAFDTIQALCTNDLCGMDIGRVRYTLVTNDNAGIVDDILVYRMGEIEYLLVVNAGNSDKMAAWVSERLLTGTEMENQSANTCQLALQGPCAVDMINEIFLSGNIPEKNYTFTIVELFGERVILSRTGYTGEDGFELYFAPSLAEKVFNLLLETGEKYGLELCGLGARDTLRLEAGMPLYGHEMNEETPANEIGLNFFIKDKSFTAREKLVEPKFKRIGLKLIDRGIAREGAKVYSDGREIGYVSSGTHSPTLGYAIAMARVEIGFTGSTAQIDVRGKMLLAEVVPLPFYKRKK